MLSIYTDGGCNPNPGGPGTYGVYFKFSNGQEISYYGLGEFRSTNNRMELYAVKVACEKLKEVKNTIGKVSNATLYSDSSLIVGYANGSYRPHKNVELVREVVSLLKQLKIEVKWVSRTKNKIADALAGVAFDEYKRMPVKRAFHKMHSNF